MGVAPFRYSFQEGGLLKSLGSKNYLQLQIVLTFTLNCL